MDDDLAFCLKRFEKDQIEEKEEEIQKNIQALGYQQIGHDREAQLHIGSIEVQRREQQILPIRLADAIRQLAIGSANANKFDEDFQIAIRHSPTVPVILGRIDQYKEKDLPLTIRLKGNFHDWSTNQSNIQQRFCAALSKDLALPANVLRIEDVKQVVYPDIFNLHMLVKASQRQVLIEALANDNETSRRELEKIKKRCSEFNVSLFSVTLGEFGLNIEERVMDPRWNRHYVSSSEPGGTYWSGSLDRGGRPYFCPKGWTRYGIKVAENDAAFDAKWGSWCIAYHGTRGVNAHLILETGLRSSTQGCFLKEGHRRVYVSPSIEYAAHPRYARPWEKKGKQNQWFQMVFQCRVNPQTFKKTYPETLILEKKDKTIRIDENFLNEELEWVIPAENANENYIKENIICYGLMVRKSERNPKDLDASHWWKYTHAGNIDYDAV